MSTYLTVLIVTILARLVRPATIRLLGTTTVVAARHGRHAARRGEEPIIRIIIAATTR